MSELRLLVHCEGWTEAAFVKQILGPHLTDHGYARVDARVLGKARSRCRRGGILTWPGASKEIIRHLREDRALVVTTMVDYYGLPARGDGAWPGRVAAPVMKGTSSDRAEAVESALLEDIAQRMGSGFDRSRFVPFVAMHEYEALLFSDAQAFAASVGLPELARSLTAIRADFATPEDINDDVRTAPSKRIVSLVPHYEKPLHGVRAILEIGLDRVRAECPHFDRWLLRLEERHTTTPSA